MLTDSLYHHTRIFWVYSICQKRQNSLKLKIHLISFTFSMDIMIKLLCGHATSFSSTYPWGSQGCCHILSPFSRSQFVSGRRSGYTLDESSAHRRALTDGGGRHTRCSFGVQYLEPGFKPMAFRSLVNWLYPLSYSRPYCVVTIWYCDSSSCVTITQIHICQQINKRKHTRQNTQNCFCGCSWYDTHHHISSTRVCVLFECYADVSSAGSLHCSSQHWAAGGAKELRYESWPAASLQSQWEQTHSLQHHQS